MKQRDARSPTSGQGQLGDGRDETPTERLDRNWSELLQELRVTQTGVQLLTAFLLSLPLQQRFSALDRYERTVYLIAVSFSVAATGLLVAPVAIHRAVFRRHERRQLVSIADRAARIGLGLLGFAVTAVVILVFAIVLDALAGILAGLLVGALLVALWWLLPRAIRRQGRRVTRLAEGSSGQERPGGAEDVLPPIRR